MQNVELAELQLTLTFEDKSSLAYALASVPKLYSDFIEIIFLSVRIFVGINAHDNDFSPDAVAITTRNTIT